MKLYNRENQKEFEAKIEKVEAKELKAIHKSKRFGFDWRLEEEYEVYKIIDKDEKIHGLISIEDIPDEQRIHVSLIEIPIDNIGKNKMIDWAAGCLFAFAADISFSKGYGGFISLIPKTELINHYIKKYGFSQFGRQLGIEGHDSIALISKYLS